MRPMDLEDPDRIADTLRRHLEAGAYWLEPAAYASGLVSQLLDALRHASDCRCDSRGRGARRHFVGTGSTAGGQVLQVGFHFEPTPPAAVDSVGPRPPRRARRGTRLLVDSAWLVAPQATRPHPT